MPYKNIEDQRKNQREWKKNNQDKVKAIAKNYNKNNRDKLRESCRKWRAMNPERNRELDQRHRDKLGPDGVAKKCRKSRQRNPQRVKDTSAAYRERNREIVNANLRAYHKNTNSIENPRKGKYLPEEDAVIMRTDLTAREISVLIHRNPGAIYERRKVIKAKQ